MVHKKTQNNYDTDRESIQIPLRKNLIFRIANRDSTGIVMIFKTTAQFLDKYIF